MPTMSLVPDDHPMMIAWKAHQATDEYANSYKWVTTDKNYPTAETYRQYVEGSLWAMFTAGFKAGTERAASLHEQINPASDQERHNKSPGAGAMGAVIDYRDRIRETR